MSASKVFLLIWGAHAPRVLVAAPSPQHLLSLYNESERNPSPRWRDAIASTRGACAPQIASNNVKHQIVISSCLRPRLRTRRRRRRPGLFADLPPAAELA